MIFDKKNTFLGKTKIYRMKKYNFFTEKNFLNEK